MRKLLFVTPAVLVLGFFGACSSNSLVGENGACFQAVDCQPGLVCVRQVCTKDLTSIATVPPEAGATDAAAADGSDATINYDSATDAPPPPQDTGVPENNPPPQDSGGNDSAPQDSGGGG